LDANLEKSLNHDRALPWLRNKKVSNLPQIPIVIPLVIVGCFLGSAWSSKDLVVVWKKALLAGALSGLLNLGCLWVLGILVVPGGSPPANNDLALLVSSGLAGFLIVLTVYLSAVGMIRYRRGKVLESESEE
jgi:hypothetical protein